MSTCNPDFQWLEVSVNQAKFLKPLSKVLGDQLHYFCATEESTPSRTGADGMWMVKGEHKGQQIAICWCDFRVKGASFSAVNSVRLKAFLQTITELKIPLIFSLNSLGFRFMEGRQAFPEVFGIVPLLNRFRQHNLLITLCQGKCLGIGAILFALGHYRIAAGKEASLNLTGPEVFQQFFGAKVDFQHMAGVEAVKKKTGLIHEIHDTIGSALQYASDLMALLVNEAPLPPLNTPTPAENELENLSFKQKNQILAEITTVTCVNHISQQGIELFNEFDDRLKVFIVDLNGRHLAVLINPPNQTNNLFSYRSLELYQQALQLFALLKLPLVVMIDTPGIDPRLDGDNQHTIEKLVSLTNDILSYPMPTVGVVNGRGYGGANTLAIPKCYGSVAHYAIKDVTNMDVMHESIMRYLLSGSKELLSEWEKIQEKQDPNCYDIITDDLLDDIISYEELAETLWQDLFVKTMQTQLSNDVNKQMQHMAANLRETQDPQEMIE